MNISGLFTNGFSNHGSKIPFHLGALLAVVAWGAALISTKVLLQNNVTPVEIYVYRFIIAYLCVLAICPRPFFSKSLADELKFVLVGLCGGSIYFLAENTAMRYTLATNVSLIVTTAPILSTLLLGLLYRSERPSSGFLLGSFIAFLGVAFVIFNSSFSVEVNPLGDLLALLAAVSWAVYTILLKPFNAIYGAWFITRKTFFYGVLTALPFFLVEPNFSSVEVLLRPEVYINLVLLGLIPSLLSYVLWAQAVKGLGVMTASNYLYISPIVTLIMSAAILSEKVSWIGYLGCAMILIGVILSEKLTRRH